MGIGQNNVGPLIDLNLCLKKTVNLINQKGGSASINFTRKIPGDISTFLKKTDDEGKYV